MLTLRACRFSSTLTTDRYLACIDQEITQDKSIIRPMYITCVLCNSSDSTQNVHYMCTVHQFRLYTECTLHVYCTSVQTLHRMYITCVLYISSDSTQNVHYMCTVQQFRLYTECTLHVYCTTVQTVHRMYITCVLYNSSDCTQNVHYMCIVQQFRLNPECTCIQCIVYTWSEVSWYGVRDMLAFVQIRYTLTGISQNYYKEMLSTESLS